MKPYAFALILAALWAAGPALATCVPSASAKIYPTAKALPDNLLRIYIYFPKPMDVTAGAQNIQLLSAAGAAIEGAFLQTREDLWSPDRRRLTMLLDPGRVKTGLEAHDRLGRALAPGRRYAIKVSGTALGADGCALGQDTTHSFTAAAPDLEPPRPAQWDLSLPRQASTEPLSVALNGAHDHLSLAYRLRVLDRHGDVVPGAVSLGPGEESWHFTPRTPWLAQPYRLTIDERLEDLAGNRPGLLFDRPLDQTPKAWQAALPFTPRP